VERTAADAAGAGVGHAARASRPGRIVRSPSAQFPGRIRQVSLPKAASIVRVTGRLSADDSRQLAA
jgi:hypothetical protein